MLGWYLYLTKAFRIGSEIFPEMCSQSWYSGTLRLVTMLEKNVLYYIIVNKFIIFYQSYSFD